MKIKNLKSLKALLVALVGNDSKIDVCEKLGLVRIFADASEMFNQVVLRKFASFPDLYFNVSWYVSTDCDGFLYAAFYLRDC